VLFPILDQFESAATGSPDIKFQNNLYGDSGSWSEYVTGWIKVMYPYCAADERNTWLSEWRKHCEVGTGVELEQYNQGNGPGGDYPVCGPKNVGLGLELEAIPCGISQAPVLYIDERTGRRYEYTFNGGIVAILQNKDTRALEPVSGWAVLDHGEL
jgi:Domain of unknown function (DUF4419)